ncbi:hypothetical protein AAVH_12542 [Aphelenchoides avenae]|nr:hypothetical protein AAVH_12542 [Aphelenchus avenae]
MVSVLGFMRYFGDTYIGKTVRGQYSPSRYEPRHWNCHLRTLRGEARTNNACEVLSQFVLRIRKLEEKSHNISVRHNNNPAQPVKGRPSADVHRERNIRALVEQYVGKPLSQRNRLDFLIRVQYQLSPSAFERLLDKEDATMSSVASISTSDRPRTLSAKSTLGLKNVTIKKVS